jgi:hypothetical protein
VDQKTLVDQDKDVGAELLSALFAAGFTVTAAFWVYNTGIHDWRLVLATPEVRERGRAQSYRAVQKAIFDGELSSAISLFRVALVSDADPIVERLRSLADNPAVDALGMPFDQEIFDQESHGEGFLYKVDALRFERDVALALRRVAPPGTAIRANVVERGLEHDFVLDLDGAALVVEVKATAVPLAGWSVERIMKMHSRGERSLLVVSRSGFTRGALEKAQPSTFPVQLVTWASPADDGVLRDALAALLHPAGRVSGREARLPADHP